MSEGLSEARIESLEARMANWARLNRELLEKLERLAKEKGDEGFRKLMRGLSRET